MILHLQHLRSDGDIDTYHLKPGRRYHIGRGSACEVRILDLKMSRKHAAVEYIDEAWRFIDLCSTNGCKMDGEMVTGTIPMSIGAKFEVGSTVLAAQRFVSPESDPDDLSSTPPASPAPKSASAQATRPLPVLDEKDSPQSALEGGTGALMAKPKATLTPIPRPAPIVPVRVETNRTVKPVVIKATDSQALDLMPPRDDEATLVSRPPQLQSAPTPPPQGDTARRIKGVVIRTGDTDNLEVPAPTPATLAPLPVVMDALATEERTFFITVLGRRLGPLSRIQARDLKARELKGTLISADLAAYPSA